MTTSRECFPVTRRLVLRSAGLVALAGFGIASFAPTALAAANDKYPEEAFGQRDGKEAIKLLYGRTAEPSDKIKLDTPEIAENGAVVPISVSTSLSDVTSVAFVVPELVIHLLEVVEVEEDQRKALMETIAARDLALQSLVKGTSIVETGEGVAQHETIKLHELSNVRRRHGCTR